MFREPASCFQVNCFAELDPGGHTCAMCYMNRGTGYVRVAAFDKCYKILWWWLVLQNISLLPLKKGMNVQTCSNLPGRGTCIHKLYNDATRRKDLKLVCC